jgi:hypothetical protein
MLVLVLGAAGLAPAPAGAASPLNWSAPVTVDHSGQPPSAISCPSESLCVAVDRAGNALTSTDPSAAAPSWASATIDRGRELTSVSCASAAFCVAVDAAGQALASTDPAGGSWTNAGEVDEGGHLTGVACPSASLCVAVDEAGNVLASTHPTRTSWTRVAHAASGLTAVACASASLCVGIDGAGDALASREPTGGAGAWHPRAIDPALAMTAISCSPDGRCVAVDSSGNALSSEDPASEAPTWSSTAIAGGPLGAVSCAASGLCVALDGAGTAHASDDPTAPVPGWSTSAAAAGVTGVSCLRGGFCVAVDAAGAVLTARVAAPGVTTTVPTEVTQTTATMAGTVDPNDAMLDACQFEYGTGASYGQSVPCAGVPAPAGGVQAVAAQLAGLLPNTTYHYRLIAASPVGTNVGADETFTTATSAQTPLVYPNPSITGTPGVGERLECHSGIPFGAAARLSYAWLRDLVAIPGASGSSYVVKGADTGHHLQCQVSATDAGGSATARSAFVTIPVEAVPASVGETFVGRAAFKNGRVSVPVTCSPRASGDCQILLRLTVSETLSGGRIVAVAARPTTPAGRHAAQRLTPSTRRASSAAATLRRVTVTLGSARARLGRGQRRTLTVSLNATGGRLLAGRRRLPVELLVSGTVIGVIEATLAKQPLVLATAAHSASQPHHHARRR